MTACHRSKIQHCPNFIYLGFTPRTGRDRRSTNSFGIQNTVSQSWVQCYSYSRLSAWAGACPQPEWEAHIYPEFHVSLRHRIQTYHQPFFVTSIRFRCQFDNSMQRDFHIWEILLRKVVEIRIPVSHQRSINSNTCTRLTSTEESPTAH
jgi:hypothetical protein